MGRHHLRRKGFKERARVSGKRPTGAASCRQQYNRVSCQPPLPRDHLGGPFLATRQSQGLRPKSRPNAFSPFFKGQPGAGKGLRLGTGPPRRCVCGPTHPHTACRCSQPADLRCCCLTSPQHHGTDLVLTLCPYTAAWYRHLGIHAPIRSPAYYPFEAALAPKPLPPEVCPLDGLGPP